MDLRAEYNPGKNRRSRLTALALIWFLWFVIDCKTVRIFAYSSTREQSNKRSGMRLKTESETGERC